MTDAQKIKRLARLFNRLRAQIQRAGFALAVGRDLALADALDSADRIMIEIQNTIEETCE